MASMRCMIMVCSVPLMRRLLVVSQEVGCIDFRGEANSVGCGGEMIDARTKLLQLALVDLLVTLEHLA